MKKTTIKTISLFVLVFVIDFSFILAWNAPTANPPLSNTQAPINISVNPQVKEGSFQSNTDIRAPIFYDYPGTDYYLDPTSISYLSDVRADIYYDRNNIGFYIDPAGLSNLNDIQSSIYHDRDNSDYYLDPNSISYLNRLSSSDVRSSIYYDRDNTDYYINPASNSWLYRLYSYDVRSSIYYDRDNTDYYINPADTSILNDIIYTSSSQTSDINLKKDIQKLDKSLDKILKLEGISFKWKDEERGVEDNLGLIAQDVEKIYPELVKTDRKTGLKSIQYSNLVIPLIEAIKELKTEIEILKN